MTYYKKGSWNGICDVCSFKFKFTELKKRWDGLIVCSKDFEQDHPQKYLRVKESGLAVPVVRDRPADVFIQPGSMWFSSPMADFGCADFAVVGGNTNVQLLIDSYRPSSSSTPANAIAGFIVAGVT